MKRGLQSFKAMVILTFGFCAALTCLAGTPQKWADLPKAVQQTILANGGTSGMSVDLEDKKIGNKAVYEAGIKSKDGTIHDLVITEDGKLIETKTDDAADKVEERATRAKQVLEGATFSRPREITNPYLPLANLKQDILEGMEAGKKFRIERTAKPDLHKTFKIGDKTIETLVFEDRAYEDGQLVEVATDYFAQDDNGAVYYFGEDVDEYEKGKIVGHEGAWLFGKDTPAPGILFPAQPKLNQKWRSEDVSSDISEIDELISMTEKVVTPSGTYENCAKVKEYLADGTIEFKYYAKGIGVVREQPEDGDTFLVSHNATIANTKSTTNKKAVAAVPFKEAKLIIEHNATDHDTGIQGFIDSEGWDRIELIGPGGLQLDFKGVGLLGELGLTELFFESVEPENSEKTIEELFEDIPAGTYTFKGHEMIDGEGGGEIIGRVEFSHLIPDGPELKYPTKNAVVSADGFVASWGKVTKSIKGEPVDIIGYQLIIERDAEPTPRMIGKWGLSMYLPASTTSMSIPREFLQPATKYKWEVLAIEECGNQTLSSGEFSTK